MDNFVVENLGPIAKAEVDFGDLTILTGPQASGKTLFLETFKLVKDFDYLIFSFPANSEDNGEDFLDYYYGEGMHSLITKDTHLSLNGDKTDINYTREALKRASDNERNENEQVYYVPAQRSLAFSEGRIKSSDDFINSPYVVPKFCYYLRLVLGTKTFKFENFDSLHNAELKTRRSAGSLRLSMILHNQVIPYMAWSTGQRELTPLLMALDYFQGVISWEHLDSNNIKYSKYIIIEEPELGLHPRAIIEFMFTVLKLMKSGVKVVISTHSSTPLDFVWAMNHLKESNADIANIAEMFDFKIKDKSVFDGLAEKVIKVYYFSPDKKTRKVYSKDISSLDVYSEDEDVSNWGGMSLSADRAGSIVSKF